MDQIYDPAETAIITYSNIQGSGYAGALGNIDQDPLFANAVAGDLQLTCTPPTPCSPCVDMGSDSAAPTTDILGLDRVDISGVGGANIADMGAYEFHLPEN